MKSNYKNSTFREIVFKKKDSRPKSWEEYCQLQKEKEAPSHFLNSDSQIIQLNWCQYNNNPENWKNSLPSGEYAKALLAFTQLISLRKAWIGDWEPNWSNIMTNKWVICFHDSAIAICESLVFNHALSFPTEERAKDFLECFKDLLEQAKILL